MEKSARQIIINNFLPGVPTIFLLSTYSSVFGVFITTPNFGFIFYAISALIGKSMSDEISDHVSLQLAWAPHCLLQCASNRCWSALQRHRECDEDDQDLQVRAAPPLHSLNEIPDQNDIGALVDGLLNGMAQLQSGHDTHSGASSIRTSASDGITAGGRPNGSA